MKGGMGGFLFAITHAPVSPFLPNSKCYTEVSLRICYGKKLLFLVAGYFVNPTYSKYLSPHSCNWQFPTLRNSVKNKTLRSFCSSHLQMYQNDKSDDDFFLVRKDVFPLIKEQKLRKYTKPWQKMSFSNMRGIWKKLCVRHIPGFCEIMNLLKTYSVQLKLCHRFYH